MSLIEERVEAYREPTPRVAVGREVIKCFVIFKYQEKSKTPSPLALTLHEKQDKQTVRIKCLPIDSYYEMDFVR